jgi:threonine dehydrogenase-like Zn-dependent dehydrogenase
VVLPACSLCRALERGGRCAFVGEGGQISFAVSELLIHKQISLYGSWVTSLRHMEDLLEHLVRWNLHPEAIVTHRFPLDEADKAYQAAAEGVAGKVCIVFG